MLPSWKENGVTMERSIRVISSENRPTILAFTLVLLRDPSPHQAKALCGLHCTRPKQSICIMFAIPHAITAPTTSIRMEVILKQAYKRFVSGNVREIRNDAATYHKGA